MTTCTCRINGRVHNLVIIATIDPHKFHGSIHKHITQAQHACNFENFLEQFIFLNCKASNYIFDSSKNFLPHHIPPNWCSMVYNSIALSKSMIIICLWPQSSKQQHQTSTNIYVNDNNTQHGSIQQWRYLWWRWSTFWEAK